MDRSAIFVDAGYLFAAVGQIVYGTASRARSDCDVQSLTHGLGAWVSDHNGGLELLRTYWYDGAINGVPTAAHEQIGGLSYVKVRLGRLIKGRQKGVDALIYRDLMTLARERAIARAYLLSGDEDLREGVVAAQDMGVQVVLLGIPTSQQSNQSAALVREADEHVVLPMDTWRAFFGASTAASETPAAPAATASQAQAAGRAFAVDIVTRSGSDATRELARQRPRIPKETDLALTLAVERTLGPLHERQDLKREMRAGFWSAVDEAARHLPRLHHEGLDHSPLVDSLSDAG